MTELRLDKLMRMMELLPKIAEAWRNDRQKVLTSADRITQHVIRLSSRQPGTKLDQNILDHDFGGRRFLQC